MNKRHLRPSLLALAITASLSMGLNTALAANNDGAIRGTVSLADRGSTSGVTLRVENPATGFSRTLAADADGNFRFPYLPVGRYRISAHKDGLQDVQLSDVEVTVGNATVVSLVLGEDLEHIEVTGSSIRSIDTSTSETALNISAAELARLPMARNAESVALLAPGTVEGSRFGGISFGGSSVGENAVFINGLNITDVETGVDFSTVPFAFYDQFQVKTGGYSVEFGRTTGGVINAVVKSGTNEFHFGAETFWEPEDLRADVNNTYNREGTRLINGDDDQYGSWSADITASGAIIQDKLFFFALYEPRNIDRQSGNSDGSAINDGNDDSAFWGGKLDWQISDDHSLSLLAFSDDREEVTDRSVNGQYLETNYTKHGGKNWALTYTGYLTDDLTAKVLWGKTKSRYASDSTTSMECARVRDYRDGSGSDIGCTSVSLTDSRTNSREALRLDFEYALGDHLLRFGLDNETRTTEMNRRTPGPDQTYYELEAINPGDTVNGAVVQGDSYVYARTRSTLGSFDTDTSAYYLEDIWSVTDNLTLSLGLRWDEFDTKAADGQSFLKVDDMLAPRFGLSWDLFGDGESKFYANLGRYYFPIANGLAAREGGGTLDEIRYFELAGLDSNSTSGGLTNITPVLGSQLGDTVTFGAAGSGRDDINQVVDKDLDPIYQDELILGFEQMLSDNWKGGVRGIYRHFNNAIEDMKINVDVAGCGNISGWVFGNPGKTLTLDRQCDDGSTRQIDIDLGQAQDYDLDGNPIGAQEVERKYYALELTLDRQWDSVWSANFSYTWSHSYGNYEGGVNSDTGNDIPGWTEAGDNVVYINSGWGNLPNDRRHAFKARGAWAFAEHWTLGSTFSLVSGRPINARGHGNPYNENTRYDLNYLCVANCDADSNADREFIYLKKGMYGTTSWLPKLDLSLRYDNQWQGADYYVGLSVFNLLDSQQDTDVGEIVVNGVSTPNPNFLATTGTQEPRYIQLSAGIRF